MDNKARIREIVERLRKRIKDPRLELDYNTPLDLLVASILAAQSQDRKVNEVTKGLFAELKDVDDYIELGEEGIAERISSINFYKRKARLIHQCILQIKKREGGEGPLLPGEANRPTRGREKDRPDGVGWGIRETRFDCRYPFCPRL